MVFYPLKKVQIEAYIGYESDANHSAAQKLKTFLMFSHDVMAAIRAIVGLIQARFHQEWNTAAKRGDAESDRYAPKVGSVA